MFQVSSKVNDVQTGVAENLLLSFPSLLMKPAVTFGAVCTNPDPLATNCLSRGN
jgi:hypothetical protein